jgi:hypothetical protein
VRTPEGKIFESRQIEIRVDEPVLPSSSWPDWEFWAAFILFGISYAVYKIRKKKGTAESSRVSGLPSAVRVKLNNDEGSQEIFCEKELAKGSETRIRPIMDQGIQEIEEE